MYESRLKFIDKVTSSEDFDFCILFQSAGNAVKRATDALVRAAQQAKGGIEEQEEVDIDATRVGGIRQVSRMSSLHGLITPVVGAKGILFG